MFCERISEMDSRVTPIRLSKHIVEVITIAHTEFVPPEALGFSMCDDAVVHSFLCVHQLHHLQLLLHFCPGLQPNLMQRLNLYQQPMAKKSCQWLI